MGTGGWRRAFCTSVRGDPEVMEAAEQQQQQRTPGLSPSSCTRLRFFSGGGSGRVGSSNPSTPRPAQAAGLWCRTKSKSSGGAAALQCETPPAVTPTSSAAAAAATLFQQQRKAFSNPSSPKSPCKFAIFKHHSRDRCRICWQSLKPSQEAPVFTAECSHDFHFQCITGHVRAHGTVACPVCSAAWRQAPLLAALHRHEEEEEEEDAATAVVEQVMAGETENRNPNRKATRGGGSQSATKGGERRNRVAAAKVYDDDEPLLLASKTRQGGGGVRFNPIPEAANEDVDDEEEYGDEDLEREDELHGLLATPPSRSPRRPTPSSRAGGVQVSVMPQAALLSDGRRHRNYVVAVKVKAPPVRPVRLLDPARGRASIDLVTVVDVSHGMTGEKLQMLKRAMRLVISSLGPADRLSMVAFSAAAGAKRILHLQRMSRQGQRAARHVVERLVVVGGAATAGGSSVGDALRKATKVLEDRRERNPVATIMLLSDTAQQQQQDQGKDDNNDNHPHHRQRHQPLPLSTMTTATAATRFAHLEIPVHAPESEDGAAEPSPQKERQVPSEDAFIKCVGGLVSVVMHDVHLQLVFPSGEISEVYPRGNGGGEVDLRGGCAVLRLGDVYAEEEKEILVELRVPTTSAAAAAAGPQNSHHHHLSVKCNYRDPATRELAFCAEQTLLLPPLLSGAEPGRHDSPSACSVNSLRLRDLFVSTRAVAESRRLAELSDYATARHLLSSARSLLLQSASDGQEHHLVQNLDAELADLERRRLCLAQHQLQHHHQQERQEGFLSPSGGRRLRRREAPAEVRGEPLTPTSAWRAAEQLAKVAIMRKSLNRVIDLHGFENARF